MRSLRELAELLRDRPVPHADEPLPPTTLVTSSDIDDLLGVSPNRLRQWVHRGQLEPVMPGKRPLLFVLGEVEKCLDARTDGP